MAKAKENFIGIPYIHAIVTVFVLAVMAIAVACIVPLYFEEKKKQGCEEIMESLGEHALELDIGSVKEAAADTDDMGSFTVITDDGREYFVKILNVPSRYTDVRCICLFDVKQEIIIDGWIYPDTYADAYSVQIEPPTEDDISQVVCITNAMTGGIVFTKEFDKDNIKKE